MGNGPWFAVHVDYWRNPKIARAGFLAGSLNLAGIAYCAEQLTDGFVPAAMVAALAAPLRGYVYDPPMPRGSLGGPGPQHDSPDDLAMDLITANLWEPTEGGYLIVNYLDHQPSRQQVQARREQARQAGQKGGFQRAAKRTAKQKASEPLSDQSSETPSGPSSEMQAPVPTPTPVHQNPTPQPSSSELEHVKTLGRPAASTGDRAFDEFWSVYPNRKAKKAAHAAWRKALRDASATTIIEAARRLADDSTRSDTFTPHPATWLNQGRWDDEGPARPVERNSAEQRQAANLALIERFAEPQQQPTLEPARPDWLATGWGTT